MFDKKSIINGLHLNIAYAKVLVKDLSDQELLFQPSGFLNHPAWTLGHLTTSLEMCIDLLGGGYSLDKDWDALFKRKGPGDPQTPNKNQSLYPSKNTLLSKLSYQEKELIRLLNNTADEFLNNDHHWKFSNYLPSKADYLHFMISIHFSWHLGQLAEWRRMAGFDSALMKLVP